MQKYADDNQNYLPEKSPNDPGPGSAIWDLTQNMADIQFYSVSSRDIFYCPGGFTTVHYNDFWWDYSSGCRVTSYEWMISRDGTQTYGTSIVTPPTGLSGLAQRERDTWSKWARCSTNFYTPGTTEVVNDVVVSQGSGVLSDQFTGVYTVNPTELPQGL